MFNIITPLARTENIDKLIGSLSTHTVKWHVITDEDSGIKFEPVKEWITHSICPNNQERFWERCNFSINWWLDNTQINDDEYYCILNDDDSYEENFFKKLKESIEWSNSIGSYNDLIICSMKRGNTTPDGVLPERRHGTHTLIAEPNNMTVGGVGVEQFFVKGKILKNHRLPLTVAGDGELISLLVRAYGAMYVPNIYVLFNYFEPGRWS
jgi:hypothetical protein